MPGRITRYRFLYIIVMILDTVAELEFKYTIMGNYRFAGLEHEKNLAFGRILLNNCGNDHNLT